MKRKIIKCGVIFSIIVAILATTVIVLKLNNTEQGKFNFKESNEFKNINDEFLNIYNKKISIIKDFMLGDENLELINVSKYHVFISVSDTKTQAIVKSGEGNTLGEAWNDASNKTRKDILDNKYNPMWVKVDVIYITKEKTYDNLKESNELLRAKGIAFDKDYDVFLLEAELTQNGIINDKGEIELDALNTYFIKRGNIGVEDIPNKLIVFSCLGYFCDSENNVYKMGIDNENYGRRSNNIDKDLIEEVILGSSNYLKTLSKEDGSFIYGYYPVGNTMIGSYNILRHSGTIWSLIQAYDVTKDEGLKPVIDNAIEFLIEENIVDKEPKISFVVEAKAAEIKLGR